MRAFISKFLLLWLCLFATTSFAQRKNLSLDRVEPRFWWAGMKEPNLQILVYGSNISTTIPTLSYPGVTLEKVTRVQSPNYLFLDLKLSPDVAPGRFTITFSPAKGKDFEYSYELRPRPAEARRYQGLSAADVMYLIMPDRFANGNLENDNVPGYRERFNRTMAGGRFGGDLRGVISKLDYLTDLGITAVWLNPVLENNMQSYSYHGYSITDFYKVDPRYGTNQDYRTMVKEAHDRQLKVVMDMVFNHCGSQHWWMRDLPEPSWLNQWPEYTQTNYENAVATDPHASEHDTKRHTKGWFVSTMPDLNQENPLLAKYLIQNSIWWIEYAGIDGIRMDTYPYPDREMMADWVQAVLNEYPNFYIVGETWLPEPSYEGYWQGWGTPNKDGYNSYLPSISDFPIYYAVSEAFGTNGNLYDLYKVISQDFVYTNPNMNKIFLDNHDVDRIYHTLGRHDEKLRMAQAFLLTTRGIPQLLYGTEILMSGHSDHGEIRDPFPGGWPDDPRNAFTQAGRSSEENKAYDYLRKLLRWRQNSKAVGKGKLKHFIPYNNIYVYSRYTDNERVNVLINNTNEEVSLNTKRYEEIFKDYRTAFNVLKGVTEPNLYTIKLPPYSATILEMK